MIAKLIQKCAWLFAHSKKYSFNMGYWHRRAMKFGKRAVINICHPVDNFEEITKRDKNVIFPYLIRLLKGDESLILDLGCGTGRFTPDLASLINGKAIGVDPTSALLEMAPKSKNVEYRVMKKSKIPLADKSVDIIWIYAVLGCIKGRMLNKTVNEINRVLKDGGLLFLTENTTRAPNKRYHKYRQFEDYKKIFPFINLAYLDSYLDLDERMSIMAGQKYVNHK